MRSLWSSPMLAPGHGAVKDCFHPRFLIVGGNQSCVIRNSRTLEACPSSGTSDSCPSFQGLGWKAEAELPSCPRKMNEPCKDAFSSAWMSVELEDSDFSPEWGMWVACSRDEAVKQWGHCVRSARRYRSVALTPWVSFWWAAQAEALLFLW